MPNKIHICANMCLRCLYTFSAGCLIDIISTKGQSGFIAFLEVVEYEYGDLFLEITGKQPRMPPRGQPKWWNCSMKLSINMIWIISLVSFFTDNRDPVAVMSETTISTLFCSRETHLLSLEWFLLHQCFDLVLCTLFKLMLTYEQFNKCSAVAEMGRPFDHNRKWGLCPFWRRGSWVPI